MDPSPKPGLLPTSTFCDAISIGELNGVPRSIPHDSPFTVTQMDIFEFQLRVLNDLEEGQRICRENYQMGKHLIRFGDVVLGVVRLTSDLKELPFAVCSNPQENANLSYMSCVQLYSVCV